MTSYRAFFLDQDDHITGTQIIEAISLRTGIEISLGVLKGLPEGHSLELWEGEKRRCCMPADTYRRHAQLLASRRGPDGCSPALKLETTQMSAISSKLAAARDLADSTGGGD
jgi:hypothetical protein